MCELIPLLVVVGSEKERKRRGKIVFLRTEASKGSALAFEDLKGSKNAHW